jgi:hypothetical protein
MFSRSTTYFHDSGKVSGAHKILAGRPGTGKAGNFRWQTGGVDFYTEDTV